MYVYMYRERERDLLNVISHSPHNHFSNDKLYQTFVNTLSTGILENILKALVESLIASEVTTKNAVHG